MHRKSFRTMRCPVACSLERVGEWWSILILRDALRGCTRFDQFQQSLDIAPNMLIRRLNALVKAGLLVRRRYSQRPLRNEYVLTARGRDFRPVIVALFVWGKKHYAPHRKSPVLVHAQTRAPADPVLVDRRTGQPITEREFRFVQSPAADASRLKERRAAGTKNARPEPIRGSRSRKVSQKNELQHDDRR
jgi:DNA-binding HxlR family transcriptional regulator